MAAIVVTCDLRDVNIHGQTNLEPFLNLLSALTDLYQEHASTASGGGGRAQKRRKLDDGASVESKLPDAFDGSKSVVLAKVSFHLRFPAAASSQLEQFQLSGQHYSPLLVSLGSFTRNSPDEFVFSLWNSSTPNSGVDVVATAPTDVVDCIVPHLETMQSLCTTNKGKKRSAKLGASFCRSLLLSPVNEQDVFRLECEIRWLVGVSVVEVLGAKTPYGRRDMDLLSRYVPAESRKAETPWVLSDFYDSVHVPLEAIEPSSEIKNSLPNTSLYPFQQRAVDWLLRRERAAYKVNGDLGDLEDSRVNSLISFKPRKDLAGKTYFVSHLRGLIICDPKTVTDLSQMLCGGILAEEMGLGKTVELIALMSLHRRVLSEGDVYDQYTNTMVKPSGATLIITPPSILEQWKSEINSHSLSLRVYHYQGIPSPNAPQKQQNAATVENLMKYDVVLTTYNVLSREVHFANPPPDRALRNEKQHQFRKSPLVQISWWRVCLDEAQMVENGVSQAATVARIIPRCNAWAVSGTPLRKDVQDLRGLLTFLRYRPFADQAVWSRLDKLTFRTIFNQIALRHTKDKIRGELQLPPQKRVVITVPFTAIEEQNYTDMIRQMCTACFLDSEGLSVRDDRDANHPEVIDRMREWLVRLRQTCLHANVGRKNRKALGAKNGPLRTIHEVLEVMIEQNDANMKGEARESILAQIRCGHIRGNAGDDDNRSEHARPFYERALQDAQAYVKICREELALEQKRLGKTDMDEEKDLEDEEKEEHNIGQIPVIRKSLRTFLGLEHACKFFLGTVFFQIKSNEKLTKPASEQFYSLEKLEAQWYEAAKKVRKELLRHIQNKAQKQMEKIQAKKPFHQIPVIEDLPDLGGIEGKKMLDMMDDISDNLNAQAKQLDKWRLKVGGILLLRLVDAEEEKEISLTGEEYEDSTKAQDELYVYIMALRTLVADRSAVVGGFKDPLTEHEMKEAVKKTFEKEEEKRGHAPELVREVAHTRDKLKPTEEMGSLKLVVSAARSLLNGLQWKADEGDIRATAELSIVRKQLTKIQQIFADQEQCLKELEHEQELFRITMNQRLEFYRQLQHISDTVAPWKEVLDPAFDSREFNRQEQLEKQSKRRVTGLKNKNNYLVNLRTENEQSNVKHECIICIMEFELGVLTTCGHKFCKECITHWWHSHRSCPLCKTSLNSWEFTDISLKPSEIKAQEETNFQEGPSHASMPASSNASIYSDISDSTMKEIKMINLEGSYGTKVDMIARHLLWIRNNDRGAKSIIFSQFGDFLEVLREALKQWKIGCSSIRDKDGVAKFKTDGAIDCFLLDAKSDSSGLNLVNATYVFLCEPLINPAIELQAIARVHRIGQQRATTVFMYLVSDTVEEAIYDMSVARRLAHIGKDRAASRSGSLTPALQEMTLEAANSLEMEAAPLKQLLRKKGDGEMVKADDLWHCLFGKPRKERTAMMDPEVGRHLRAEAAESRIEELADAPNVPQ